MLPSSVRYDDGAGGEVEQRDDRLRGAGASERSQYKPSTTFQRFATAEEIGIRLQRRFPSVDKDIVDDFAHAVSINKYSYADAKKMLGELTTLSTVEQAVVDAIEVEKDKERRKQEERERKFQEQLEAETRAYELAAACRASEAALGGGRSSVVVSSVVNAPSEERQHSTPSLTNSDASAGTKTSMITSACAGSAALGDHEVILYVTSMTANRLVRTHCRLLHQLLYIKKVDFTELDVADNPFLQKFLGRIVSASPQALLQSGGGGVVSQAQGTNLPLLFVGEQFVGNYEHCQRLEDDGVLMAALASHGYTHVEKSVEVFQREHMAKQLAQTGGTDLYADDDLDC